MTSAHPAPPPGDAALAAQLLLLLHDQRTAPPHITQPPRDPGADRREFDSLAAAMYRALGRPIRLVNANVPEALRTALDILETSERSQGIDGVARIELLDTDPTSPTCGQWITNQAVTGPGDVSLRHVRERAVKLFHAGHTVQVVWAVTTPMWTSQMPWERPTPITAPRPIAAKETTTAC